MAKFKWVDQHIELDTPTKRNKKITGTRLGAILGANKWNTPFATWCEITKTYVEPYEDTIYTIAGKTIEPKQIEYMKKAYLMDNIKTPTDIYGEDYFNKTYGDFYGNIRILGGMWDALIMDSNGKPDGVLEFKTTKRAEDWQNDIPEYYALQAALYAYLLGVDDVCMVCSFLEPKDYENPDEFVLTPQNTITKPFKVSERYPNFKEDYVDEAIAWWEKHIVTGISPDYDEKKDADILKELRKSTLVTTDNISDLLIEADKLQQELDITSELIKDKEKRLKEVKALIQEYALKNLDESKTTAVIDSSNYSWTISKGSRAVLDKEQLEIDQPGLLDKYTKQQESIRMTVKRKD